MNAVCTLEPERCSGSVSGQADGMDENPEVRVTRLESDVKHIQSDISEIKVELRRLNDKIDGGKSELGGKIDGIKAELASIKMWAFGLYVGLAASLLFVMAQGFKWL